MEGYSVKENIRIRHLDRFSETTKMSTKRLYATRVLDISKDTLNSFKNLQTIFEPTCVLPHPNILQNVVSYVDEINFKYIIYTIYCKGKGLNEILYGYKKKGKRFSETNIIKIMSQIFQGINYLHKHGIMHQNISPECISITSNGRIKITGFGIPRNLLVKALNTRKSEVVIDEISLYSSPEVLRGEPYDFTDDIWSLGCVFYELCCLHPPNIALLRKEGCDESIMPEDYSEDIRKLVMSMLSIDRGLRPSCEELLENTIIRKHINSVNYGFRKLYEKLKFKEYVGDLIDNRRNGKGILYYKFGENAEKFVGKYKNDQEHGKGILYYKNGDRFEGKWKKGLRSGKGTYYFANGNRYEGSWGPDGKINEVTCYYTNGDKYVGEFAGDTRNGNGILYSSNGDVYEGKWYVNLRHGHGVQTYANGESYDGNWKYDHRYSLGIENKSNGEYYNGMWENDVKEGIGSLYMPNGDMYEGNWMNNKKNGMGFYSYANGDSYEGIWKSNKREGQGVCYYANGNSYAGEWKNNKIEGIGTFYFANNEMYYGDFVNYHMHGTGIYKFANGDRYYGKWRHSNMHGEGYYIYANGITYQGKWKTNICISKRIQILYPVNFVGYFLIIIRIAFLVIMHTEV